MCRWEQYHDTATSGTDYLDIYNLDKSLFIVCWYTRYSITILSILCKILRRKIHTRRLRSWRDCNWDCVAGAPHLIEHHETTSQRSCTHAHRQLLRTSFLPHVATEATIALISATVLFVRTANTVSEMLSSIQGVHRRLSPSRGCPRIRNRTRRCCALSPPRPIPLSPVRKVVST